MPNQGQRRPNDIFGRSLHIIGKKVLTHTCDLNVRNGKVRGDLLVKGDINLLGNLNGDINGNICGDISTDLIVGKTTGFIQIEGNLVVDRPQDFITVGNLFAQGFHEFIPGTGFIMNGNVCIATTNFVKVNDIPVVGQQQPPIPNGNVSANVEAALIEVLDALRAHGLIAT